MPLGLFGFNIHGGAFCLGLLRLLVLWLLSLGSHVECSAFYP